MLLGQQDPEGFFPEWLDSYFARDVQELFRVEKRAGFLRLLELLLRQSGGLLDVSRLATEAQVVRAMGRLSEGRTTLLIAHRLQSAARADRVAVGLIEDGLVRRDGDHVLLP